MISDPELLRRFRKDNGKVKADPMPDIVMPSKPPTAQLPLAAAAAVGATAALQGGAAAPTVEVQLTTAAHTGELPSTGTAGVAGAAAAAAAAAGNAGGWPWGAIGSGGAAAVHWSPASQMKGLSLDQEWLGGPLPGLNTSTHIGSRPVAQQRLFAFEAAAGGQSVGGGIAPGIVTATAATVTAGAATAATATVGVATATATIGAATAAHCAAATAGAVGGRKGAGEDVDANVERELTLYYFFCQEVQKSIGRVYNMWELFADQ